MYWTPKKVNSPISESIELRYYVIMSNSVIIHLSGKCTVILLWQL